MSQKIKNKKDKKKKGRKIKATVTAMHQSSSTKGTEGRDTEL